MSLTQCHCCLKRTAFESGLKYEGFLCVHHNICACVLLLSFCAQIKGCILFVLPYTFFTKLCLKRWRGLEVNKLSLKGKERDYHV